MTDEVKERFQNDAGDGTKAEDQLLHGPKLILCCIALLLCMFLVALDQTIVTTILSTVGNKFGDFANVNWISSGFMLPIAVLSMNWGKFSIIFGRKYAMLVAIFLFELGSLICALAKSMNMLIGGRVLAGVGGGGVQAMVFMIVSEVTTMKVRPIAQGLVGVAFTMASVLGPVIGGLFTDHVSWRWCFYINLPIGGLAAAVFLLVFNPPFPHGSIKDKLKMIDYVGTVLLTSGLVIFLLGLTLAGSQTDRWDSAIVICFFVFGGCLLIAFTIWNFTLSKSQLFPTGVATKAKVLLPCLAMMYMFLGFMCEILFLTLFFQVVKEAKPLQSGLDILPTIIPVTVMSILSGLMIGKTGYTKPICMTGAAVATIGLGLISTFNENVSHGKRIGYQILVGAGFGSCLQPIVINTQVAAPNDIPGAVLIATSMINFFRAIGGSIGGTLGQTIMTTRFHSNLKKIAGIPVDQYSSIIDKPELIQGLPAELKIQVLKAFIKGFQGTIYLAIGFLAACFVCASFFTNERIETRKGGKKGKQEEDKKNDIIEKVVSKDASVTDEEKALESTGVPSISQEDNHDMTETK